MDVDNNKITVTRLYVHNVAWQATTCVTNCSVKQDTLMDADSRSTCVQIIRYTLPQNTYAELIPIPYSTAYKHVIKGGPVPAQFAASRTVFIPKSSDVDNNGRIVRSPEALRPLTLCNCDCKILTTATCRGLNGTP